MRASKKMPALLESEGRICNYTHTATLQQAHASRSDYLFGGLARNRPLEMNMPKMSGVVRLAGTALLASFCMPVAVVIGQTSTETPPTRQILDRYCVTCHNERLKTAGLMLDQVDVGDIVGNAEVLEKVVRKLRAGQMPPEGRPRPDVATIDAVATSLESAL
ncbi:uncharacterized protein METZ01_LOCUS400207, partial [marine metagenome]